MKLKKRLLINNTEVQLSSHKVSLKLSNGGVAFFVFAAENQPKKHQAVRFDIGYGDNVKEWFEGYIEDVLPAENGYYKVEVRENAGIMRYRHPLSIEHPTMRQVIAQLSELTGLDFVLPEKADYIDTPIPNFVCHGTGYQCLKQIAKAFSIPDMIWYQDLDQRVFVGAFEHSRFFNKPVEVPADLIARQYTSNITFAPFPMLRPGAITNNHRLTRIDLVGDEMTAHWARVEGMPPKKRETLELFPELAAGYHLPKFGRVEYVRDNATSGQTADPFRPRYAIDVQLLDENMEIDSQVPVYRSVPLPVHMSGHESGLMAYPLEGTIVEIAFAYGRNDRPIIRGIYGREHALPTIEPGEQLQQQREEVSHRIDAVGNTTEQTDQMQKHIAFEMHDKADRYLGEYGQHKIIASEHSIEEIIGKKLIETLGAINLLAGDDLVLGSLGNMQTATAGEYIETIGKVRRSITKEHQWLQAPKTWVGSKNENVLKLLSELMQVVKELADTLASHTHPGILPGKASTEAPNQAGAITGHGGDSGALKARLDPITK